MHASGQRSEHKGTNNDCEKQMPNKIFKSKAPTAKKRAEPSSCTEMKDVQAKTSFIEDAFNMQRLQKISRDK